MKSGDEKYPKRAHVVLPKGGEVVGPGYSRLIGVATKVTDRGEILCNPSGVNRVSKTEQHYPSRVSQVSQDNSTDRQADWVSQVSQNSSIDRWADQVSRVNQAREVANTEQKIGGSSQVANMESRVTENSTNMECRVTKNAANTESRIIEIQLTRKVGLHRIRLTRKAGL
jgi:hypothetical protein